MSFLRNLMFWRTPTEDVQREPLGDTSFGSEAKEPDVEHLDPNQNVNLPSIRDEPFVPIDTQQILVPPEDMNRIETIGYTFGRKLGTGSFGEVYRCQFSDRSNNIIELAVKLILMKETLNGNELLEAMNSMRTEQISLSIAVHPHVVAVQNCVTSMRWNRSDQTQKYYGWTLIFLELADSTLEEYMTARGTVPEEETKEFLAQIVVSVGYLHSIGVAHRDIRPVNVLLFRNVNFRAGYLLKICDFGIAHLFDVKEEPEPRTDELVGNIMYRAPETDESHWANKEHSYDPRLADVYSIGVMLVQMLAGYRNVRATQLTSSRRKHAQKFLALFTKLGKSEDVIDLVNNMVQYHQEDRCDIAFILQHRYLTPPEQWMPYE